MDRRREEGAHTGAEGNQGGRRDTTEEKQQRRGMKIVHVCCGILRQLNSETVEAENREE